MFCVWFVCVHYLPRVLSCSYWLLCSCERLHQQESSNRFMSMAPTKKNLINGPLGLLWAASLVLVCLGASCMDGCLFLSYRLY